jgi:Small protein A (tmRNA-binding)
MKKSVYIIMPIIFIIALFMFARSETYFYPYPDIDTIYTEAFSYEKFAQVRAGMTKEQVQNLLGSPISSFNTIYECWSYSKDGKLAPIADFAWIDVGVCFENDKVIETYRDCLISCFT